MKKEDLINQSKENAIKMLTTGKEMFLQVLDALKEDTTDGMMDSIRSSDKDINHLQIETRKMIYEHLAISKGKDLLTGLQLNNIIIDLERIGDYTKNIGELIDMFPKRLDFSDYETDFTALRQNTLELFDLTKIALESQDEEKAKEVLTKYEPLSKMCDSKIKEVFESSRYKDSEMVEKKLVAFVLMSRFLKRVNAHLKNVASTMVNPFHRFGYRHKIRKEN